MVEQLVAAGGIGPTRDLICERVVAQTGLAYSTVVIVDVIPNPNYSGGPTRMLLVDTMGGPGDGPSRDLTATRTDIPLLHGEQLRDGALGADVYGRAKMAAGFFDTATILNKFAAGAIPESVLESGILRVLASQKVNGLVTANTPLIPATRGVCCVLGAVVRVLTAVGVSVVPQANIFTSVASDVIAVANLTGLTAAGAARILGFNGQVAFVGAGAPLNLGLTGGTGTTLLLGVDLVGFYLPSSLM